MVLQEVVDKPVSGVYKVSFVLEQMVDALDDIAFSEHKNTVLSGFLLKSDKISHFFI